MHAAPFIPLLKNFELFPREGSRILKTVEEFFALPIELRGMYYIQDRAVFAATQLEANNEPLITLNEACAKAGSKILPSHGTTGYGSQNPTMQLRVGAIQRLFNAEKIIAELTHNVWSLKVTDAYRPLTLQREYYTKIRREFQEKEGLTGQALYDRIAPLIADPDVQPPHTTGGTVDLTLYDIATHTDIDMGGTIDDFTNELTWTWHRDLHDLEAQKNRCLLFWAMSQAGFINTPQEWWHYQYGDREWALRTGAKAALYEPL